MDKDDIIAVGGWLKSRTLALACLGLALLVLTLGWHRRVGLGEGQGVVLPGQDGLAQVWLEFTGAHRGLCSLDLNLPEVCPAEGEATGMLFQVASRQQLAQVNSTIQARTAEFRFDSLKDSRDEVYRFCLLLAWRPTMQTIPVTLNCHYACPAAATWLVFGLCLVLAVWFAWRGTPRCHPYFWLLTILALMAVVPFFLAFTGGHDGDFHLQRLISLTESLCRGLFPAWLNIGPFRYGSGLFYSDFLLLPAAGLCLLGWSPMLALTVEIALAVLATSWGTYYVVKRLGGGALAGFLAGFLVVWGGYPLQNLYQRFALGEILATCFYPWVLLGSWDILHGDRRRFLPLTLGLAGMMFAHNLTVLFVCGMLLGLVLLSSKSLVREPGRLGWLLLAGLLALALSAAFWLPLAEQLASSDFVCEVRREELGHRCLKLWQLLAGWPLPHPPGPHWKPAGFGLALLLAVASRFLLPLRGESRQDGFRDQLWLLGLAFALPVVIPPLWNAAFLTPIRSIQFPWRLLLPATFLLAMSGSLAVERWTDGKLNRSRACLWTLVALQGVLLVADIRMAYRECGVKTECVYALDGILDVMYLPAGYAIHDYYERGHAVKVLEGAPPEHSQYLDGRKNDAVWKFSALPDGCLAELPRIPYLGYQAELVSPSGQHSQLALPKGGQCLRVRIPPCPEGGEVRIDYAGTKLQTLGGFLSLVTALALLAMAVRTMLAESRKPICH